MPWTNALTGRPISNTKEEVEYIRAREGAAAADLLREWGKMPMTDPRVKLSLYNVLNTFPLVGVKGAKYARDRSIMTSTKPSIKKDLGQAYLHATQGQAFGRISRGWTRVFSDRSAPYDRDLQYAAKLKYADVLPAKEIGRDYRLDANRMKDVDVDKLNELAGIAAPYYYRLRDELSKYKQRGAGLRAVIQNGSPELKTAYREFTRHAQTVENTAYLSWIWDIVDKLDPDSDSYDENYCLDQYELCAAYHQFLKFEADKKVNIADGDRRNILDAIGNLMKKADASKEYFYDIGRVIQKIRAAEDEYQFQVDRGDNKDNEKMAEAMKDMAKAKKELRELKNKSTPITVKETQEIYPLLRQTYDVVHYHSSGNFTYFDIEVRLNAEAASGYPADYVKNISGKADKKRKALIGELNNLGMDENDAKEVADRVFHTWDRTPFAKQLRPGAWEKELVEIDRMASRVKTEYKWQSDAENTENYTDIRKKLLDKWRKDWIEKGGKYGGEVYYDATDDKFKIAGTKWYKKLYNLLFNRKSEDPNEINNISVLIRTRLNQEFSWLKTKDGKKTLRVGSIVARQVFGPDSKNLRFNEKKRRADAETFKMIDAAVATVLSRVAKGEYADPYSDAGAKLNFTEETRLKAQRAASVFRQGWNSRSDSKNLANWKKNVLGGIRLERRLQSELEKAEPEPTRDCFGQGNTKSEHFWKKFKAEWLAHGLTLRTLAVARKHLAAKNVMGKEALKVDFADLYQTVDLENKCKAYSDAIISDIEVNLSEKGLRDSGLNDDKSIAAIRKAVAPALADAGYARRRLQQYFDVGGLSGEEELSDIMGLFHKSMVQMEKAIAEFDKMEVQPPDTRSDIRASMVGHKDTVYDLALATMPQSARADLKDRIPLHGDPASLVKKENRLRSKAWRLPNPNEAQAGEKGSPAFSGKRLSDKLLRDAVKELPRAPKWLREKFGKAKYDELRAAYNYHRRSALAALYRFQNDKRQPDEDLRNLIAHLEAAQTLNERLELINQLAKRQLLARWPGETERVDNIIKKAAHGDLIVGQALFLREALREANRLNELRNSFELLGQSHQSDDRRRIARAQAAVKRGRNELRRDLLNYGKAPLKVDNEPPKKDEVLRQEDEVLLQEDGVPPNEDEDQQKRAEMLVQEEKLELQEDEVQPQGDEVQPSEDEDRLKEDQELLTQLVTYFDVWKSWISSWNHQERKKVFLDLEIKPLVQAMNAVINWEDEEEDGNFGDVWEELSKQINEQRSVIDKMRADGALSETPPTVDISDKSIQFQEDPAKLFGYDYDDGYGARIMTPVDLRKGKKLVGANSGLENRLQAHNELWVDLDQDDEDSDSENSVSDSRESSVESVTDYVGPEEVEYTVTPTNYDATDKIGYDDESSVSGIGDFPKLTIRSTDDVFGGSHVQLQNVTTALRQRAHGQVTVTDPADDAEENSKGSNRSAALAMKPHEDDDYLAKEQKVLHLRLREATECLDEILMRIEQHVTGALPPTTVASAPSLPKLQFAPVDAAQKADGHDEFEESERKDSRNDSGSGGGVASLGIGQQGGGGNFGDELAFGADRLGIKNEEDKEEEEEEEQRTTQKVQDSQAVQDTEDNQDLILD